MLQHDCYMDVTRGAAYMQQMCSVANSYSVDADVAANGMVVEMAGLLVRIVL
jgi:hypothetical protein